MSYLEDRVMCEQAEMKNWCLEQFKNWLDNWDEEDDDFSMLDVGDFKLLIQNIQSYPDLDVTDLEKLKKLKNAFNKAKRGCI